MSEADASFGETKEGRRRKESIMLVTRLNEWFRRHIESGRFLRYASNQT